MSCRRKERYQVLFFQDTQVAKLYWYNIGATFQRCPHIVTLFLNIETIIVQYCASIIVEKMMNQYWTNNDSYILGICTYHDIQGVLSMLCIGFMCWIENLIFYALINLYCYKILGDCWSNIGIAILPYHCYPRLEQLWPTTNTQHSHTMPEKNWPKIGSDALDGAQAKKPTPCALPPSSSMWIPRKEKNEFETIWNYFFGIKRKSKHLRDFPFWRFTDVPLNFR